VSRFGRPTHGRKAIFSDFFGLVEKQTFLSAIYHRSKGLDFGNLHLFEKISKNFLSQNGKCISSRSAFREGGQFWVVKNLWKDFSTKGVARVERSGKVGGVGGVDLR
jgi:hypothetical protein